MMCKLPNQWDPPCRFSTKQTRPGDRDWPDPLELMDGHWAPDGTSLAVTDACGQLHIYGTADVAQYAR